MNRKSAWLVTPLLLACVHLAEAQQPKRVPRVGFLGASSSSAAEDRTEAFRQGLRELGYIEGKNIVIEWRYADGNSDRLPAYAAELLRLNPDVLILTLLLHKEALQRGLLKRLRARSPL
jgi:putative tryptophan/tyrosine transport system substrate-binding protein